MEIKNWWVVVIIIVLLIASIVILIKNYNEGVIGDKNEVLNLKVKECCKYMQNGEEKTCTVLERYSCDYCSNLCN
ncbi:MAG: hypothetical protein V1663_05450 [archaeon]